MKPSVLLHITSIPANWSSHPLQSPKLSSSEVNQKRAFVICHIFTIGTLLPLVLVIKLLKLKRSQVVLNLFLALCLNSNMALLMGFSPKYPPRALCLLSSAGSRAGTALISVAAMNTVLMVWALVRQSSGKLIWKEKLFGHMLIWLPWVTYALVLLMNVAYLLIHPRVLYVDVMTCYSKNICADISHVAAGIALLVTLVFNIWSIALLSRLRRQAQRQTDVERELNWAIESTNPFKPLQLSFEARVMAYSFAALGGLIVSVVVYARPHSHIPALYQSACGVFCFLVFGTQTDIWKSIHRLVSSNQTLHLSSSDACPNPDTTTNGHYMSTSVTLDRPTVSQPMSHVGPTTLLHIGTLPSSSLPSSPLPPLAGSDMEPSSEDTPGSSTDSESKRGSKDSSWSQQDQDMMVGLVPCLMYDRQTPKPQLLIIAEALAELADGPKESTT